MHDESLNRKSFARRASPRKDRLLTTFGSAPFCSTCQSNQRLIVSLLSSYLPPSDDDPDYEPRLASFAAYKASMHARYPPVCERCAPLVEEEIRKKDVMARSNALGSWLNESKKKDTQRQVLSMSVDRHKLNRELRWWAARGVLWVATLVGVVSVDVAGATGRLSIPETSILIPSLTALVLLSILWTAWLPTYASFRRAELQGRKVRVRGRERYAALQIAAWLVRTLTASLITLSWHRPSMDYLSLHSRPASIGSRIFFSFASCTELLILVYSFLTLRLHRPPAVRLIDASASRASTPNPGPTSRTSSPPLLNSAVSTSTSTSIGAASAVPSFSHPRTLESPELLDGLSLSTAPTIPLRTWHAVGPVFGHPSLRPAIFSPVSSQTRDAEMRSQQDEEEDNAMDWTPTASPVRPLGPVPRGDGRVVRNVAASDATTGLETLLERTNIDSSSEPGGGASFGAGAGRRRQRGGAQTSWSWGWVYALSLVPLIGVVYYQVVLGVGFFALS